MGTIWTVGGEGYGNFVLGQKLSHEHVVWLSRIGDAPHVHLKSGTHALFKLLVSHTIAAKIADTHEIRGLVAVPVSALVFFWTQFQISW